MGHSRVRREDARAIFWQTQGDTPRNGGWSPANSKRYLQVYFMNSKDYHQARGTLELGHDSAFESPSRATFFAQESQAPSQHKSLTFLEKLLAYWVAASLLAIGLIFMIFRRGKAMRQRFSLLSSAKDRLQGLLRDIQRKNEPKPHIR